VPGLKTNERPGTRAVLRHYHMSATKARQVLDLIRNEDVLRASEILRSTEREAAAVVSKVLASAVANAVHNDEMDAEDLYVSACYADEASTLKRWRARARGRASRINKRQCHITVIVSRLPDERLMRRRAEREAQMSQRSRRVAESRRRADLSGRLSRRRAAQAEAEAQAAAEAEAEAADAEAAEVLETEDLDVEETDVVETDDSADEDEFEDEAEEEGEDEVEADEADAAATDEVTGEADEADAAADGEKDD
jgi:large subunit ribosomal protein L22